MCVVSNVHDFFNPQMPKWDYVPFPSQTGSSINITSDGVIVSRAEIEEVRKLIADFREAIEAALTVDRLTGQPDCVDPEKAVLSARVEELEGLLRKSDDQLTRIREIGHEA